MLSKFFCRSSRLVRAKSDIRVRRVVAVAVEAMEPRRLLTALLGWDVHATSGYGASPLAANTVDASVANSLGLTRGSGVLTTGTAAGRAWGGLGWTAANSADATHAATFGLTVAAGKLVSFTSIDDSYRRSSTGPATGVLAYQINGGAFTDITTLTFANSTSSGATLTGIDLSGVAGLQNLAGGTVVNFAIVPLSGGSGGSWYLFDVANTTADDLVVNGTAVDATVTGTPSIGSFGIAPSPIAIGGSTTLTVTNVVETGGTGSITGVNFYLESNGTAGLQVGGDTLVGAGTQSGTTFTRGITGNIAGTFTYYAVAADSNGKSTAPSSATLTVVDGPSIDFSSATYTANEADGTATITVNLSKPATATTTIKYATSDGVHFGDASNANVDGAALAGRDYTTTSGTLTFNVNDTSKTFVVPLLNVKTFAGTRTVKLTLSNPNSAGVLGTITTAALAITDNAVTATNGVDLPTGTPSYSVQLLSGGISQPNGFIAFSPSSTNGFGSGANVGPVMPFIEFSTGSSVFPTGYNTSTVDSVKLSLFNTATGGSFGGKPGSFDVYILTADGDAPLVTPSYRYLGPDGTTSTGADGNTGPSVIGGQGTPLLVGSATFTNNVVGFNDFIFDNLSASVKSALTSALNAKTPIRFVITPSTGSGVAADWEGNSSFAGGAEKPQLTLIAEKSLAVVENFALDVSSITVNKGGTATITVDRSGADLSDAATVAYNVVNGSAIAGTDFTAAASGTLNFAANATQASFTIAIANTATISADKFFTVTISNPQVVGGLGHVASLVAPTTERITIHDVRTTNLAQQAGDVATVQPAGPRTAPNGKNFFNVEGSGAAASASFGVADFNTAGLSFTLPGGETIGTINSILLGTINAPASFTHSGGVNVYLVDDSTTDISSANTALTFNTADATEGLNGQFGAKHLLGSFTFDANQPGGTFTDVALANADPATLDLLKNDLNTGVKFRLVFTPEDATVAATYTGTSFGIVDGAGSTYQAPRVTFNYTKADATGLPAWVSPSSVATWDAGTHKLTVTGATTIVADPGADAPIIVASGGAAQVTVAPAGTLLVHLGGLDLSGGAGLTVSSLGSTRRHDRHVVLVLGTTTGAAPLLSIISGSKFDLRDNDLIVHNSGPAAVAALAAIGRAGGAWTGLGLTSSSAAQSAIDNGQEVNALAVAWNADLGNTIGQFSNWTVGSAVEPLRGDGNDVIVKYTYVADFTLDGVVDGNDVALMGLAFDNGASSGNPWAYGDTNGDGKIDGNDVAALGLFYGIGLAGSGYDQM
jgi:hypothetical protein